MDTKPTVSPPSSVLDPPASAGAASPSPSLHVGSLKLDVERSAAPPPNAVVSPPASPGNVPLTPAPGESARAFAAFCAYLQLGPARRYAAVARTSGVSLRTVKSWSSQFDWRGRLNRHSALAAAKFVQTRQAEQL